jgi:hypothetical protein
LNLIEIISSQYLEKSSEYGTYGKRVQLTPCHVMNQLLFHLREGKWRTEKFRKDQARKEATNIGDFTTKIIRDYLLRDGSILICDGPADKYRKDQLQAYWAIEVQYPEENWKKFSGEENWREERRKAIDSDLEYRTDLARITKTWHAAAQPLMDLYCDIYNTYHKYYVAAGELPAERYAPEIVKKKVGWLGK